MFENAAYGMLSLLTDAGSVKEDTTLDVRIEGADNESMLVNWLNELLYYVNSEQYLFGGVRVSGFGGTENGCFCRAEIKGSRTGQSVQPRDLEIKSATYHELKIEKDPSGYRASVIFDV